MAERTGFALESFIDMTDVMSQHLRAVTEFQLQVHHSDRYR